MEDDDEPTSPEEIDEQLESLYGDLLDVNQEIISNSRFRAKGILELREVYLDQAKRCDHIAELYVRGAQVVASTFGDILSNEWGVEEEDVDGDGEEEGDD